MKEKCHPPSKDYESWLVDPLKFVVDLPAHEDIVYVAVVSYKPGDSFVLHEVYQQQPKQVHATFDIVQPQRYLSNNIFPTKLKNKNFRTYDIRVGDCSALLNQSDDKVVRIIADDIVRSIHK